MSTTSIDDILTGSAPAHLPKTSESMGKEIDESADKELINEDSEIISAGYEPEEPVEERTLATSATPEMEVDDYGNAIPKPESKTYTEDEVNDRINRAVRERLARMERNNPEQKAVIEQAREDFTPNTNSAEPWQEQLESFIEQTLHKRQTREVQQQQRAQEQQATAEFEAKFHSGMGKFKDFREVVSGHPITDAMTVATRAMKDPAAFLYAAAKQQPKELERISKIPDQYAQMVEIGKLDERMRKAKATTNAPRPVSQSRGDMSMPVAEKTKEPSIEDLIRFSENKKRAQIQGRLKK